MAYQYMLETEMLDIFNENWVSQAISSHSFSVFSHSGIHLSKNILMHNGKICRECFISKQMLLHTQNARVWFCSNINHWHLTVHLLALFYLWYFSLIKYTSDLSVSHCLQLWISHYTFHVTMLIVTDLFWLSMSFNLF